MLSVGGAKCRFAGVELRLQSHSLLNELIHLSAAPALRQGNNLKSVVQLRILHGEGFRLLKSRACVLDSLLEELPAIRGHGIRKTVAARLPGMADIGGPDRHARS